MYLPEDVGIPFGGAEEANFYVLATHYENEESFTSKTSYIDVNVYNISCISEYS
jgi:hypothetical protein